MDKTCAFIFARGGSKGLPRKNILPIANHPLFVHGIIVAKQLNNIDGIYVSTDCDEIADVAKYAGAQVIKRPVELASDNASEWLAWQHAIKIVEEQSGHFERFLSLPPTAPLRSRDDVEKCLNALVPDVDIVVTMTMSRRSPWFNMVEKKIDGRIKVLLGDSNVSRRQDSPECFDMTTVAYAAKSSFILNSKKIWDGRVAGVEVPAERAFDIDTPLDFAIAKFVMEQYLLDSQSNS
jgi:N-acylneuraminate cytidylyltransferase